MEKDINLLGESLDWPTLVHKYSPTQVAEVLAYKNGMLLASKIFSSNIKDDALLTYAIDVIFSIRRLYPNEWNQDWKNDVYLSNLCTIIWKYDESYKVLRESCEKLRDPPAPLLYELADCYNYPPEFSSMSEKEAEDLLKKSLSKELTYEAAINLREIYGSRKDIELYKHYDSLAKETERNDKHIENMTPNVLKDK